MTRRIPWRAALLVLAIMPAGTPAAGAAPPPREPKAIVLGIDGATADVMEQLELPTLEGIAARGLYSRTTLYVPPAFLTVSGVGWATMATGTWPDKHDIRSNSWPENRLERFPSVLERLERTDATVRTAGFSVWPPMVDRATPGGPILGPSLDVRERLPNDVALGDRVGSWIRTADVDAAFLQFDDVDGAGHASGADSRAYAEQLQRTDKALGTVLAGIRARPTFASEDWLVVVSSDHGHNPEGGHGGPRPRERTTYVLAEGGRVRHEGTGLVPGGTIVAPERKLVDLAPSILDHLGFALEPRWGLDGRPFWTPSNDPFDRQSGALVGGVTSAPPPGWAAQGWRFGTDPWHTQTFNDNPSGDELPNPTNNPVSAKEIELDERENFLEGRGVRAIADAAAAGGPFDASLTSEPYDVAGARAAVVRFAEAYRGTADQIGEVLVSFDGGPPRVVATRAPTSERRGQPDASGLTVFGFEELKGLGAPVPLAPAAVAASGQGSSKVQRGIAEVDAAVPAGARLMRVTWRLRAAGSGWFWSIDEPRVELSPPRDRVAPTVRGLRVLLRSGLSYDLSEAADIRIRLSRAGRMVTTLRRRGTAGRNINRLPRRRLRPGVRYQASVTATDVAGNRSSRPVVVRFRYRRGG